MPKQQKSALQDVVAREYTIHMHPKVGLVDGGVNIKREGEGLADPENYSSMA